MNCSESIYRVNRAVNALKHPAAPVAILCTRAGSPYQSAPGAECYDVSRDAFTYDGPHPVVAHPPCRLWGRLHTFAKASVSEAARERALGVHCVRMVEKYGGVLEQPAASKLWRHMGLPAPGERIEDGKPFTLALSQFWFGHRARKDTWIYLAGIDLADVPEMPMRLEGLFVSVENMGLPERERTPPALCTWLLAVARSASYATA